MAEKEGKDIFVKLSITPLSLANEKAVMDGKTETVFRILKEEWIEEETEWIFLWVRSTRWWDF